MKTLAEVMPLIEKNATLGKPKSINLYNELVATKDVPGSIAEIGIFQGKTAHIIKTVFPDKTLHLYDTFSGIVGSDPATDKHANGDFANTSLDSVKALIGEDNVYYHVGMFPDTFTESNETFSFVHSDTDTYFGTMETLKVILPLMSTGGKLLFDDYKWHMCPGVELAINDFLKTNSVQITTKTYPNQFCITKL